MNKPIRTWSDPGWLAAVGLLLLLQFWWLPGDPTTPDDTYSTTLDGKRGFYQILEDLAAARLLPSVCRESETLLPDKPCTLVLLSPDRNPDAHEQQGLSDFVRLGGTLLFAPRWDNPGCSLSALGIRISATETNVVGHSRDAEQRAASYTSLLDANVLWSTSGVLEVSRPDADVLVRQSDGRVQAAAWTHGSGLIVVSASADAFSNRAMLNEPQAELAIRLLLRAHKRHQLTLPAKSEVPIVISEYLNASDAYRGTGILMSPALRSGTLQLITVAVLLGWFGFHRFGPPGRDRPSERRRLSDSAIAVGRLYFRSESGAEAVRLYLEYVRTRRQLHFGRGVHRNNVDPLAAQSELPGDDHSTDLDVATGLAEKPNLTNSEAAQAIRELAQILPG